MEKAQKELIRLLEQHLAGYIHCRDFLSLCPKNYESELIEDVINIFCEPLSDWTKDKTWQDVAELCLKALCEDWAPEKMYETLENF